jgi:hypothetical protein
MIMLTIDLERPRMLTFKSTAALCGALEIFYRSGPGEPGRKEFEKGLQTSLKFSEKQARLYASTVLSNNSETSAGYVRTNAARLVGTWRASGSNVLANIGYGGNALSSTMEEWTFFDDLTYRYSLERQTSFMSPYGSVVRPSSTSESGLWAPPDRIGATIDILLLPTGLEDRKVRVDWLGSTEASPTECSLGITRFRRS